MDGWRRFARVEARIKGEITNTWREVGLFCITASFIFVVSPLAYKKKIGRVSAGSRVDPPGRPGFIGPTPRRVFA
jgi:hypothetical protein